MTDANGTLATVRQTSYLRAGTKLHGTESREEFLQKTGMDFRVEAHEVRDAESGLIVPGVRSVCRVNPGGTHGVPFASVSVGNQMHLFQNEAAFAPLMDVVDRGLGTYVAGGTFKGGAVTWGLVDLGKSVEIERLDHTPDPVTLHLFARNAHNGSSNLIWGALPERFYCTNQLNGIAKGLQLEVKIPHRASGTDRVEKLAGYLGDIVAEFHKSARVWQALANRRMDEFEFETFARTFLVEIYGAVREDEDESVTRRRHETRERKVSELVDFFQHGKGNTGESYWDAYNGVAEWLEHRREDYRQASWTARQWENDAASQAFGTARNRRTRALRMLTNR